MSTKSTRMPNREDILRRLLEVADLPGAINDRFYTDIADSCSDQTVTANQFVLYWCSAIMNLEGLVLPDFTAALMLDFPMYVRALIDDQELAQETIDCLERLSDQAGRKR